MFDTYNGYLRTLNRIQTIFITNLEKVGTVIVKAETYHKWVHTDSANENIVFIKFSVMPHKSRLTLHKLVMRDSDIKRIVGEEIHSYISDEKKLIWLYTKVFNFIRVEKRINYSYLGLPLKLIDPNVSFSKLRVLKNTTSGRVFEETDSFISHVIYSRVTLCKLITKIKGTYAIISVMKDLSTRLISLNFYFPIFKREHTTFLFISNFSKQEELATLNALVKNKIEDMHSSLFIPRSNTPVSPNRQSRSFMPKKKTKELHEYKDYLNLVNNVLEEDTRFANQPGLQIRASNKRPTNILGNMTNMSYTMGIDMSYMDHTKMAQETNQPDISTTISRNMEEKFKVQLYWEILSRSIQVTGRPRNKLLVNIGQWSNILKEVVFFRDAMIGSHLYSFEVIAEYQRPGALMAKYKSEMFQNIKGIYYFIKVRNISKNFEKHEKMSIFKAIELLGLEFGRTTVVNIYTVKSIGFQLSKKIYLGLLTYYKEFPGKLEHLQTSLIKLIDPQDYNDFCLHSRICSVINISEVDRFEQLYKTCIIKFPPVLLTILLSRAGQYVLFLLYNQHDREILRYKVEVASVITYIPMFYQLLDLNDKLNLGKRLLATYKNTLIVEYTLHRFAANTSDSGIRPRTNTRYGGEVKDSKSIMIPAYRPASRK